MTRHMRDVLVLIGRQAFKPALDPKIGNDGREVGIAAAFAETNVSALHMRRAVFNSNHAVGYRHATIVMRMNSDRDIENADDIPDDFCHFRRETATVGVA